MKVQGTAENRTHKSKRENPSCISPLLGLSDGSLTLLFRPIHSFLFLFLSFFSPSRYKSVLPLPLAMRERVPWVNIRDVGAHLLIYLSIPCPTLFSLLFLPRNLNSQALLETPHYFSLAVVVLSVKPWIQLSKAFRVLQGGRSSG